MEWKQRELLLDQYIPDNMGGYIRQHNVLDIKKSRAELTGTGLSSIFVPITVQYTGVKDINGKKIFEGDIVESESEEWDNKGLIPVKHQDIVEWGVEDGQWIVRDIIEPIEENVLYDLIECKILGNVFQNQELVEKYKLEVDEND